MPPRKRPTLASLKAEAWAELKRGQDIYEAEVLTVRHRQKIRGLCVDDNAVYVNPNPDVVEVLLHELIHRTHPRMTEEQVATKALRIMVAMTDTEIRQWMKQYRSVARKKKAPIHLEDDEDAA